MKFLKQKYTCFCVFANILTQKPVTVKCVKCVKIQLTQRHRGTEQDKRIDRS